MSDLEVFLSVVFGLLTLAGIVWVKQHRHKVERQVNEEPVPVEVRRSSHDVKNQVTSVRAGLRRIQNAPDPLSALVDAIRGREGDAPNSNR